MEKWLPLVKLVLEFLLKLLGVGAVGYGLYYAGSYFSDRTKLGAVERLQGERYVVFNTNDFFKGPGDTKISALATVPGFEGSMEYINGAVFSVPPDPDYIPEGWVVEKDEVMHIIGDMCVRQTEIPCPDGGNLPGPTPVPTPPPNSGPENFLWWAHMVHAPEAQRISDGSSTIVCVSDTGIDLSHPSLKGRIIGGADFTGTGSAQDDQGHGTHVAGIISGNGANVSGISKAKLIASKGLDSRGSGMTSWLSNSIAYCVQQGAHVINASWGSDSPNSLIQRAVQAAVAKGVVFIAAAGNNGGNVGFPAGYPESIAISAVDKNGKLASFSSRGQAVDFTAPGVDIVSLQLGGGAVSMSGTSMATPMAVGVWAIAHSAGKTLRASDLRLPKEQQGAGMVDAIMSLMEQ